MCYSSQKRKTEENGLAGDSSVSKRAKKEEDEVAEGEVKSDPVQASNGVVKHAPLIEV